MSGLAEKITGWRQHWVSRPLLKIFRRVSPRMSQTEREALNAGSVWWDGELFSGRPHWNKLRSLPPPRNRPFSTDRWKSSVECSMTGR